MAGVRSRGDVIKPRFLSKWKHQNASKYNSLAASTAMRKRQSLPEMTCARRRTSPAIYSLLTRASKCASSERAIRRRVCRSEAYNACPAVGGFIIWLSAPAGQCSRARHSASHQAPKCLASQMCKTAAGSRLQPRIELDFVIKRKLK